MSFEKKERKPLKFGSSNTVEEMCFEPNQIDLGSGRYDPSLSGSDMDKTQDAFWTSFDRVLFLKPLEVITKVLEANGYVANFENVLACLDSLAFGVKAKVLKNDAEHLKSAEDFIHCVQFKMPSKHRLGDLLAKFYKEIESYESEIARVQSEVKNSGPSERQFKEARDELARIRQENELLKHQVAELSKELGSLERSRASLSKVIEQENMLPSNLRLGRVKTIRLRERLVTIRFGRKTVDVPLYLLPKFPKEEARCILHFNENEVEGVTFYDDDAIPFQTRLAKVLYKTKRILRLRDDSRNVWNVDLRVDQEKVLAKAVKRGDQVLGFFFEDKLIKFEPCYHSDQTLFTKNMNETFAKKDLGTDDLDQVRKEIAV
ncbi:MAG: hypothetical protein AB7T49_13720 [Oligoflexales bacterium]